MNMERIELYCEPFLVEKGWRLKPNDLALCWKCGKARRAKHLLNAYLLNRISAFYHYITICDFGHGCNTGKKQWPKDGTFVEWRGESGPERDAIREAFHALKKQQPLTAVV